MEYRNLFINSYNKNNGDTNYDYNLSIPEYNISCGEDEEISLTLTSFNTPNIFYNITEQNNKFIFKTIQNGTTTTANMTIPLGIYDVYSLTTAIDVLIIAEGHCVYLPLVNKIDFRKKNSDATLVYIDLNSELYKILNMPANVDIQILKDTATLSGILNMNRFNYLIIYINGITCYNQNISNITNANFKLTNQIAIINRADALPFGNICYVEVNENNKIKLGNKQVNNLNIKITDEFGNLLTDLDNWTMVLKFVIEKKI
jgi:hypothetical protein